MGSHCVVSTVLTLSSHCSSSRSNQEGNSTGGQTHSPAPPCLPCTSCTSCTLYTACTRCWSPLFPCPLLSPLLRDSCWVLEVCRVNGHLEQVQYGLPILELGRDTGLSRLDIILDINNHSYNTTNLTHYRLNLPLTRSNQSYHKKIIYCPKSTQAFLRSSLSNHRSRPAYHRSQLF